MVPVENNNYGLFSLEWVNKAKQLSYRQEVCLRIFCPPVALTVLVWRRISLAYDFNNFHLEYTKDKAHNDQIVKTINQYLRQYNHVYRAMESSTSEILQTITAVYLIIFTSHVALPVCLIISAIVTYYVRSTVVEAEFDKYSKNRAELEKMRKACPT